MTSFIPTGNATATRAADQLSFPFPARPQAMTVYVRFIERGTQSLASARVWQISNAAGSNPRLLLFTAGLKTQYGLIYTNASGTSVQSNVAVAPAIGATVEVRAVLAASGSVQLAVTVNNGTETVGAASAALALPQTWSDTKFWLNSVGTSAVGQADFRALYIGRGAVPLASCRRLAGLLTRNG